MNESLISHLRMLVRETLENLCIPYSPQYLEELIFIIATETEITETYSIASLKAIATTLSRELRQRQRHRQSKHPNSE